MIELFNRITGEKLGVVSEAQFDFLMDFMEDESAEETPLIFDKPTIDQLKKIGGDPELVGFLREALGSDASLNLVYHIVEERVGDHEEE